MVSALAVHPQPGRSNSGAPTRSLSSRLFRESQGGEGAWRAEGTATSATARRPGSRVSGDIANTSLAAFPPDEEQEGLGDLKGA